MKKAQLKIQEMAFMIVAVILFFILVGLFAISIIHKNLQESAVQIKEEKTLSAIENLAGTAEFICPETKSNCVDGDKLMALINKKNYKDFWDFSSLKVLKSTGFSKEEKGWTECTLGNYPDCDVINVYDTEDIEISSFVALCWREYENNAPHEKCEIAKLIAGGKKK